MVSSSSQGLVINPSPKNPSLLHFQSIHVSEHIWDGREHLVMKVKKCQFIPAGLDGVSAEILPHLEMDDFAGVAQLANFPLDRHLITPLVERWRPETHTFHMPLGECIITLQDIAIQIGLRVDGLSVFAATSGNWPQIVEDSLGIRPPPEVFVGSSLKLCWLDQHFTDVAMHN
ncbi:serine/threonine-protein phosphatase 7 long form homolog [Abrus precatorius]|uniref:Serine/threonine-protein phosphatase 7 long form homolog n=1 Tax=Abrus precatorius TaxID=3816 RepID=A0A8B8LMX3_ABRPR|nr:serine/threonine-protein phosphatase 7 long form homolog [Abrus precatorius]